MLSLPYYQEVWKDIPDYEGLYQISNFFKVRSLNHYGKSKNNNVHFVNGKMLKLTKDEQGYLIVRLCKNGVSTKKYVHRLMAELFIPNPHNYPTVDHINRIKSDNKLSNLRWADYSMQRENTTRKKSNKRKKPLTRNYDYLSKPVIQITVDGQYIAEYPSGLEAQRQTGIKCINISMCCRGVKYRHTAGGYFWKYK